MHSHSYGPGALLVLLSLFFCILNSVSAVSVNRTIDDAFGDSETGKMPIFAPRMSGVWKDQTCQDCRIVPDTKLAFEHTYTSATYIPRNGPVNITMAFNGTAVYVFLIVSNQKDPSFVRNTNCVFKLDGQIAGNFDHVPDLSRPEIEFHVLAFAKKDIPFGQHTLITAIENIDINSYINFDYAIYTYDSPFAFNSNDTTPSGTASPITGGSDSTSPETTPTDRSKAGAIVGGLIGGVACTTIIIILWWFYFHRPRRNQTQKPDLLSDDNGSDNFILPMHQRQDSNRRPAHLPLNPPQRDTISTFAATDTPFDNTGLQSSSDHTGPSNPQIISEIPTTHHHHHRPHHHIPMHTTNPDQQRASQILEEELNNRLWKMQDEVDVLTACLMTLESASTVSSITGAPYPRPPSPHSKMNQDMDKHGGINSIPELKTRINLLHQQIKELRSPQILGLTDDPPSYS